MAETNYGTEIYYFRPNGYFEYEAIHKSGLEKLRRIGYYRIEESYLYLDYDETRYKYSAAADRNPQVIHKKSSQRFLYTIEPSVAIKLGFVRFVAYDF